MPRSIPRVLLFENINTYQFIYMYACVCFFFIYHYTFRNTLIIHYLRVYKNTFVFSKHLKIVKHILIVRSMCVIADKQLRCSTFYSICICVCLSAACLPGCVVGFIKTTHAKKKHNQIKLVIYDKIQINTYNIYRYVLLSDN